MKPNSDSKPYNWNRNRIQHDIQTQNHAIEIQIRHGLVSNPPVWIPTHPYLVMKVAKTKRIQDIPLELKEFAPEPLEEKERMESLAIDWIALIPKTDALS